MRELRLLQCEQAPQRKALSILGLKGSHSLQAAPLPAHLQHTQLNFLFIGETWWAKISICINNKGSSHLLPEKNNQPSFYFKIWTSKHHYTYEEKQQHKRHKYKIENRGKCLPEETELTHEIEDI